jgi:hypothetical protein
VTKSLVVRDIDDLADQIPDKYLACRVDNHAKVPSSIGRIADMDVNERLLDIVGAMFVKTRRCRNRCGVVWFEVVDKDGRVLWESGADYTRAPDYLVKGLGRLKRSDRDRLRLEQIQRAIEKN